MGNFFTENRNVVFHDFVSSFSAKNSLSCGKWAKFFIFNSECDSDSFILQAVNFLW